jgi:hypothetical protein
LRGDNASPIVTDITQAMLSIQSAQANGFRMCLLLEYCGWAYVGMVGIDLINSQYSLYRVSIEENKMANDRHIIIAIAALVTLLAVLSIHPSAHACGRHIYHTLTIMTTVGGTTCPAPGTHAYANGSIVTVNAIACSGYRFSCWDVDDLSNSTANPITMTMNENHTIEAVFIAQSYTLTIIANSGGTTNPIPGNYSYLQGTNVRVTAKSDAGYHFSIWLLDGSPTGSSNNITITMNSNHMIEPVFSRVVPEFPTITPLAIFFIAALLLALLYKKADRSRSPNPGSKMRPPVISN